MMRTVWAVVSMLLWSTVLMAQQFGGEQRPPVRQIAAGAGAAESTQEQALRAALIEAEKAHGELSIQTSSALRNLAMSITRDVARLPDTLALVCRLVRVNSTVFGDLHDETAFALQWQGALYNSLAEYALAVDALERSLAIFERLGNPDDPFIAIVFSRLAEAARAVGDDRRALAAAQRSLAVYERVMPPGDYRIAIARNNVAEVHQSMGRYADALPLYQSAVALGERGVDRNDVRFDQVVGRPLGNLGRLYFQVGDLRQAQRQFELRMQLLENRAPVNQAELAYALNDLAHLAAARGDNAPALASYQRSLALLRRVRDESHPEIASSLNNQAALQVTLGNLPEAERLHGQALAIREQRLGPDSPDVAQSLTNMANVRIARGDAAGTLPLLLRAVVIYTRTDRREGLWQSFEGLRKAHAALGQSDQAVLWGKRAVNALQSLRGDLVTLDSALQASYLDTRRVPYQGLADLLIEAGRLSEAQQVLQLLKEHDLYESIDRAAGGSPRGARAELTGFELALMTRYDELANALSALGAERQALERKRRLGSTTAGDPQRLAEIVDRLLPAADNALKLYLDRLSAEMAGRKTAPRDLTVSATRLRMAIEALAISEPTARAVGLQYVVTDRRLSILLSASGQPTVARQLPIDRQQLDVRVRQTLLMLSSPRTQPALLAAELRALHAWLIEPVAADLKAAGAQTIMLSTDDVLRRLPFAALTDGQRYLIQDYTLAYYNEAARQALEKPGRPEWRLAAMGMSKQVGELPALPGVQRELRRVLSQPRTSGDVWLDRRFDRVGLGGVLGAGYNVLHVASHFVFVSGRADLSALLLGDGTRLSLGEIVRNNLRFDAFDLVTLSACETAIGGGVDSKGQELESLGATTQNQGAQSVLASLWRVRDLGTAAFMEEFYRQRGMGANKAQALRAAQIAFIDRREGASGDGESALPYLWAPFVLMGNWR